jgi:transposase InsO family protein
MEQRVRFVLMVQDDLESFASVCGRFGISRKTGYKWWHRFESDGLAGLEERSHRPGHSPAATSPGWCKRVLLLRTKHPRWGPKKLRARLLATGQGSAVPAASTMGRILAEAGMVGRARRRRPPGPVVMREGLTVATVPNEVWAVDFKGWFRLGNGERCEPLTVSDLFTRYILCCAGGADVSCAQARRVFEALFKKNGLPAKIRVDNGPPFGSLGAAGLGRLAVWWVSLGIGPEFIAPGHPEQNGSHERMHRTLKAEAIHPVACSRGVQQKQFDRWRWEFNYERPHEALGQVTPASLYENSMIPYRGAPPPPAYPEAYVIRRVRTNGEIRWAGGKRFIGEAFTGQILGIKGIGAGQHLVYFHGHLLGEIDDTAAGGMKPVVVVMPKKR